MQPILWLWVNAIAPLLDYTRCYAQNRWCSVNALLRLRWRSVDALLMLCWCSVDALLTLSWRSVDALLTLCWCSVDALLMLCWQSSFCVVTTTLTTLPIQAANTSIMDKSCSLALGLYQMQHPKLLTLCLCSVDTLLTLIFRCCDINIYHIDYKEPNTPIMGTSRSTALGLYKMQHPKSMTLCWRSFSEWGCDHVDFSFAHKGCQYVDYG